MELPYRKAPAPVHREIPVIDEAPAAAVRYAATENYRPIDEQPLAPRQQATSKKAGWSLFGRKKASDSDMRAEPRVTERPRASATPMQRPVVQEQAPLAPPPGEDLFPDHGMDEQFEIPAFLRRQSN